MTRSHRKAGAVTLQVRAKRLNSPRMVRELVQ